MAEPLVVSWDALAGDPWATLAALGRDRLVILKTPPGCPADPATLIT